jgi:hypothetical protein
MNCLLPEMFDEMIVTSLGDLRGLSPSSLKSGIFQTKHQK